MRIQHDKAGTGCKRSALAVACLTALLPCAARADFSGLGDLPGGANNSSAFAISADGMVVVGAGDAGNSEAFRWTAAGGMASLGIASTYSAAYGVSADGGTIVGYYNNGGHTEAFRWTPGGYTGLGVGGYTHSFAFGVSADGDTVVGHVQGAGQAAAYAWTSAVGMLLLDYLPGSAPASYAYGVSGDGAIAVGSSRLALGGDRAVRWDTATGAVTALGFLPASTGWSRARAISSDGLVIVGEAQNGAGDSEAFRWTQAGGMAGLGSIAGYADSYAVGVSADGAVVVGGAQSLAGEVAFYWSQAAGMRTVQSWLSDSGVNLGAWQLTTAYGVSGDGQTVVGVGYNPAGEVEAFIARPGALVGVMDLGESAASLGEVAHLPAKWGRVAVTGDAPGLSGLLGWSAAPVYQHLAGSRSDLGGAALTWRTPGLALAGRMGVLHADTGRLHADGAGEFNGVWLGFGASVDLADATRQPGLQGLELDAGIHYGRYDADIRRNYLNGASVESARGDADGDELAALLRLAWRKPMGRDVQLLPHVQYLYRRAQIDAYEETGAALAGRVAAMQRDGVETAVGVSVAWQAGPNLEVRARYGLHHLHDRTGAPVSVVVPGMGTVSSAGVRYDANWHALGVGVDWSVGRRTRLRADLSGTSGSDYPEDWSASLALNMGF